MEGSHIYEGDLIYVQQCNTVAFGTISVVLIGEEATVKKVIYKNDLMILEASNPKYASRYFTPEEVDSIPVRILSKVRFVRTDF
ncbi:LexA family protein [Holdemanella porci]|uniref:LexA family protein n=1 Tax=Holdemanella porci TaxID=2652276 RepID=UPI00388F00D7